MIRKFAALIAALIATAGVLVGLTAPSASAATPQQLGTNQPLLASVHPAKPVYSLTLIPFSNSGAPVSMSSLTPAVCSLGPVGAHGERVLSITADGFCTIAYTAPGGGGFDPMNTTRTTFVF